jgi:hypothetical protein
MVFPPTKLAGNKYVSKYGLARATSPETYRVLFATKSVLVTTQLSHLQL